MYRVKTKNPQWRGYDTARLNISVGQPYHEGEKLHATTGWIRGRFNACVLNVCDTLQRHNMGGDAHAARVQGDAWLERNGADLSTLPQLKITRWDDWTSQTDYIRSLDTVMRLYAEDSTFREAVEEAVRPESPEASRRYILEETAVGMVMARDRVADIYPGSFLPLWDVLKGRNLPVLQSMTRLNFRRKSAPALP